MRILLTGAGGAAAISVWKSLSSEHELYMADMDPCAAGLYLVPATKRFIIPAGNSSHFITSVLQLCIQHSIEVVLPTVDAELLSFAHSQDEFLVHGIKIPISSTRCLQLCRDKYELLNFCEPTGLTPQFQLVTEHCELTDYSFPCFAKPCLGSGSQGARVIADQKAFDSLPKDGSYLVQELLPGAEYSVDVYIESNGHAVAAIPRLRMKIDSGIAVAARTQNNPELIQKALQIAQKIQIRYIANVQFKANNAGEFKLLEVNPRFPGTLPLTAAAGIDIPKLLIKDLHGESLGTELLPFQEVMVVRYWTEQFISIAEWSSLCSQ